MSRSTQVAPSSPLIVAPSQTLTVSGSLEPISTPRPLVCISQHWPSQLITALSLKLPVKAAYFPKRFHPLLEPLRPKSLEFHIPYVSLTTIPTDCIYVVSGDPSFIEQIVAVDTPSCGVSPQRGLLPRTWTIVHSETAFRGQSPNCLHNRVYQLSEQYGAWGFHR
jgi:hypothetical protein